MDTLIRKWSDFEKDAKAQATAMHSRDPTGEQLEKLPRVYEKYLEWYEKNSSGVTALERSRNRAIEQKSLGLIAPLGRDPQARPRSEVSKKNKAGSTNNNSTTSTTTSTTNNDPTTDDDDDDDNAKSNQASSLATGATLTTSSLSSPGKKRKPSKKTKNTKRTKTNRDRTKEYTQESEDRSNMLKAMTEFMVKNSRRSTAEIMNDYEKAKQGLNCQNATDSDKQFYAKALSRLKHEMAEDDESDTHSSDSDSDSDY